MRRPAHHRLLATLAGALLLLITTPLSAFATPWNLYDYNSATGSAGFFAWAYYDDPNTSSWHAANEILGGKDALSLGTDDKGYGWLGYVQLGEDGDTTSIENMKGAIDLMAKVNDYRAKYNKTYGLSAGKKKVTDSYGQTHYYAAPLKTNDYLMAVSQIQLDWSAHWMDHSANHGSPYGLAENLAWGYSNPFSGWYDSERNTWLNAVKKGQTPNYMSVGHYLNIIDDSYSTTGFAMGQLSSYGVCHGEVFSWDESNSYDMAAYKARFMRYYKAMKAAEFKDVNKKTAHFWDIMWLASTGVTEGYTAADGTRTFRPLANVARADMAAFMFRLARYGHMVDDDWAPSNKTKRMFVDVDEGTPHAREIWWMAEEGISKGWLEANGTTTFRPYANVARADMAAFIKRFADLGDLSKLATPATGTFKDVNDSTPHAEDIAWLAGAHISIGWTEKDGSKTFRPYNKVARADMAAFLHRLDELSESNDLQHLSEQGETTSLITDELRESLINE